MSIVPALLIIWLHFVADFLFQSDKVSRSKSGSNAVLLYHVSIYSLPFVPFAAWYFKSWALGALWLYGNAAAHFATDYITSRMTSRLWKAGKVHWFFVVIGADQAIHMTTLFLSFIWLVP